MESEIKIEKDDEESRAVRTTSHTQERSSLKSRLRKREWDPTSVISPERGPARKKEIKKDPSVPSKRSLNVDYDKVKKEKSMKIETKKEKGELWADMSDDENEETRADTKSDGRHGSRRGSRDKRIEMETDPQVLQRRQKQIDYGKNTLAYDNYVELVPKNERKKEHPKTPNKYERYSRRGWDGTIKVWRKQLAVFDPDKEGRKKVVKKTVLGTLEDADESLEDLPFDLDE